MQTAGLPPGEPKDGDFVAYLAQIEARQLAVLGTRASAPTLDAGRAPGADAWGRAGGAAAAAETGEVLPHFAAGAEERKRLARAALFALFGVFLTFYALLGDGGLLALLIGLILLWRAAVSVRRAVSVAGPARRAGGQRLDDRP